MNLAQIAWNLELGYCSGTFRRKEWLQFFNQKFSKCVTKPLLENNDLHLWIHMKRASDQRSIELLSRQVLGEEGLLLASALSDSVPATNGKLEYFCPT
ncbi:hypothetical protein B9Z55_024884 [Caenorhabditis nigoni]|uniref:Uncharacterized protein n=1 Tax=Caenorhabditis nigoni TaxID=1611254 RepID=A0A2G5SW79_9PELO|nr:hypothetical protein B9Z55_024884 [Caenorhabditis nigoni]